MDREVPFEPEAICEGCGAVGAFDIMGDYLCPKCIAEFTDPEDHQPIEYLP